MPSPLSTTPSHTTWRPRYCSRALCIPLLHKLRAVMLATSPPSRPSKRALILKFLYLKVVLIPAWKSGSRFPINADFVGLIFGYPSSPIITCPSSVRR